MNFGCKKYLTPDNSDTTLFSTGRDRIDKPLGGGIHAGELTEVLGFQARRGRSLHFHLRSRVQSLQHARHRH